MSAALAIGEPDEETGKSDFVLDLDHILGCLPPVDGSFSFRVAPAVLT